MQISSFFTGYWLLMLMTECALAYVIPVKHSSRLNTSLKWFGTNNNKKESISKEKNTSKPKDNDINNSGPPPFIFLYGKPQHDWSTGKPISEDSWVNKKRANWLVKPKKEN
jgi:hypothetical protein